MRQEISSRQAGILCFIMMFSSKIIILPSLIYADARDMSILVLLTSLLFESLLLYFFIKIKEKYQNSSFFEILSKYLSKIVAKIIYFLSFVFFIFIILYILNESYIYLVDNIYEEATIFLYLLIILSVVSSLAFKGLTALARTAEFYFVFIIAGVLVCLLLGFSSISQLEPPNLVSFNFSNYFGSLFKFCYWFGDCIFFVFILDNLKVENAYGKRIMRYVFSAIMLLVGIYLCFYFIYKNTSFMHIYAISDLIKFLGKTINLEKLNIIPILIVMFLIFIQVAIYFYCINKCIEKFMPITNKAQNTIIVLMTVILGILYFQFYNRKVTNILMAFGKYFALIFLVAIPIYLLFLLLFDKNKKKGEK